MLVKTSILHPPHAISRFHTLLGELTGGLGGVSVRVVSISSTDFFPLRLNNFGLPNGIYFRSLVGNEGNFDYLILRARI